MCGSNQEAHGIAAQLLEERLIACANIISDAESVFRWKGNIETDTETMLLMKTQKKHVSDITARVFQLHSYELPEVSALPITDGATEYLNWIAEET